MDGFEIAGDRFTPRPISFVYGIFAKHKPGGDGIILCNGELWRRERARAHDVFRKLAQGDRRTKRAIQRHTRLMVEGLHSTINGNRGGSSAVLDPVYHLSFCFGNIIQELVFGWWYTIGSPEFLRLKHLFDETLTAVASPSMLVVDCWPWLRHVIPTYYKYCRDGFALQKFFADAVDERMAEFIDGDEREWIPPGDNFIDIYLQEHWTGAEDRQKL